MATPRQAAAMSSRRASSGSSPLKACGTDRDKKEKEKKVDWDDVEAKAKREAMWLLEWRKQQAAGAAASPVVKSLRKRRRKPSSDKCVGETHFKVAKIAATETTAVEDKPSSLLLTRQPSTPPRTASPAPSTLPSVLPPQPASMANTASIANIAGMTELSVPAVTFDKSTPSGTPEPAQEASGTGAAKPIDAEQSSPAWAAEAAVTVEALVTAEAQMMPATTVSAKSGIPSIVTPTAEGAPDGRTVVKIDTTKAGELETKGSDSARSGEQSPERTSDHGRPSSRPEAIEAAARVDTGDGDDKMAVLATMDTPDVTSCPPIPLDPSDEERPRVVDREEDAHAADSVCASRQGLTRSSEEKGMCLLAAVAVGRALEEARRGAKPRHSAQAGKRGRKSKVNSCAVTASAAETEVRPRIKQDRMESRTAQCRDPNRDQDVIQPEDGDTSFRWRPRELRFIVKWEGAVAGGEARESPASPGTGGETKGVKTEMAMDAWWQGLAKMPVSPGSTTKAIGADDSGESADRASPDVSEVTSSSSSSMASPSSCDDSSPAVVSSSSGSSSGSSSRSRIVSDSGFRVDGSDEGHVPSPEATNAVASELAGVEGAWWPGWPARGGWDKGCYSLRCLPDDALAALEAAGASSGMDRDMLDAAEAAEEEERQAAVAAAAWAASGYTAGVHAPPVTWGDDGSYDGRKARRKRGTLKRKSRRKRETHVIVSESDDEDGLCTTTSVWAGLEEAAKAEAKALLLARNSGMVEAEADDKQHWVRRSIRAAGASAIDTPHVVKLLQQIKANDPEVEVLKLHHYLGPDVNTAVIDAVLETLMTNNNCQALYIQNFNEGFRDEQVAALAKVLRRGNIWCLNAGENYKVELSSWWDFVEEVKSTNVTHAYLSEHVITPDLKNAMRKAIRDNRVKHTRHKRAWNLEVIRRCTNMWWNPINSKELQAELKVLDASYLGTVSPVRSPVKRVPCSLHPPAVARPPSPDMTDSRPNKRGPCLFQQEKSMTANPNPLVSGSRQMTRLPI